MEEQRIVSASFEMYPMGPEKMTPLDTHREQVSRGRRREPLWREKVSSKRGEKASACHQISLGGWVVFLSARPLLKAAAGEVRNAFQSFGGHR